MIVQILPRLPLPAQPQPDAGVSYAAKIDKSEARVNWACSAVEIVRQINGLSPFPGAWVEIGGERVKLLRAAVANGQGSVGAHLGGFVIACGLGAVQILEVQREGKRRGSAEEYLRGASLPDNVT
jgi:methionyl-tRNA formyltransferase